MPADRTLDLRRGAVVVDDDGDVALGRLVPRWGGHPGNVDLAGGQSRHGQLGDDDAVRAQVERLEESRVELAHSAGDPATRSDPRGPAGVEIRIVGEGLPGRRREAETASDQVDHTDRVLEVEGLSRSVS